MDSDVYTAREYLRRTVDALRAEDDVSLRATALVWQAINALLVVMGVPILNNVNSQDDGYLYYNYD